MVEKIRLKEFLDRSIAQEDVDEAAIEALEDAEDIADAKAALAEPGSLSLAEFRKELGHRRDIYQYVRSLPHRCSPAVLCLRPP